MSESAQPRRNRWGNASAAAPAAQTQNTNNNNNATNANNNNNDLQPTMNVGTTTQTSTQQTTVPTTTQTAGRPSRAARWGALPTETKTTTTEVKVDPNAMTDHPIGIKQETTTSSVLPLKPTTGISHVEKLLLHNDNHNNAGHVANSAPVQVIAAPQPALLANLIPGLHPTELVQHFASLPNGKQYLTKYKKHLLTYTPDYLSRVIPPGFTSISPPEGYVPPTRTQANMVFIGNAAGTAAGDDALMGNETMGFNIADDKHRAGVIAQDVIAENIGSEVITGHALEYDLAANSVPEELEGMRLTRVDYAIFADLFTNTTKQLVNNYNKLIESSPQAKEYYEALKTSKVNHFDITKLTPDPKKGEISTTGQTYKKHYHQCLIFLLLIKNGLGRERKAAQRRLIKDAGKNYKLLYLLPPILNYLEHHVEHNTMDQLERHILFNLIMRLLIIYRTEFTPYLPRLINITRTLLVNPDYYVRHEGGAFIQMLTKVLGLSPIVRIIMKDVTSDQDHIRDVTARVFGYITSIVGVKAILSFLQVLLNIPEVDPANKHIKPQINIHAIDTGLRIVQKAAGLLKKKIAPYMNELLLLIIPVLAATQTPLLRSGSITHQVLVSITSLCDASAPYICPALAEIQPYLFALLPKSENHSRALTAIIRCISSFLGSLPLDHARVYWQVAENYVIKCCTTAGDSNALIVGVTCMNIALQIVDLIPPEDIEEHIVQFIKTSLLTANHCSDQRSLSCIKSLFLTVCKRVNFAPFLNGLIDSFSNPGNQTSNSHMLNIGYCQILSAIIVTYSEQYQLQIARDGDLEPKLLHFLINLILKDFAAGGNNGVNPTTAGKAANTTSYSAFGSTKEPELFGITQHASSGQQSTNHKGHIPAYILNTIDSYGSWTTHPFIDTLTVIMTALGKNRSEHYVNKVYLQFKHSLSNMNELRRYHAATILARVVPLLQTPSEENKLLLKTIWTDLNERLGEEKPLPLSAILCAMYSVIATMQRLNLFMEDDDIDELNHPSPVDCFLRVFPILQNGHECVILTCNRLLCIIGTCWGHKAPSNEWLRIITQYITTHLNVQHRVIRKTVVKLVGVCANAIGSADVVLKLLPNLASTNRTVRVGITSCLGCVAETCGIAMVLPLLYHYYENADFKTSTGILKAIVICIQQCAKGEIGILPQAIWPLLAHTLTSKYSKIIRIGLQIATTLMLNATIHNYNEVGRSLAEAISSLIHPLRGINYNINSWWWEYRQVVASVTNGLGLNVLRTLYTGMFHCAERVRSNHWVWYNHALLIKQHQLPMHHMKITMADKLVYNTTLDEMKKIVADNDGVVPADQPLTQYVDPYIYTPLTLPF